MLSVSKLCCPVCWDLLAILGEGKQQLSLRGRHFKVYGVELPKCLPVDIVDRIYKQYQQHLRQEIEIMLRDDERGGSGVAGVSSSSSQFRRGHVTHESESNISVASTNFSTLILEKYED